MAKPAFTLLVLAVAASAMQAAVIRGLVVENRTGYSVSSATVTLQSIPSAGQAPRIARTGDSGEFAFGNVSPGAYLIKASRRGFMPMEYGQKRWNSAGAALVIENDSPVTVRLPLTRYSSITGTVRDPNEVGIPDQDVAAYTSTEPPRFVTRARSDDRGVFRISGLEPGTWLVRTTGGIDDDRSYLPTFSRQTLRVEDARPVVVYLDEDATDGDVRPIAGKLFDLSGSVALPNQPAYAVVVTLASDMGRTVSNGLAFHFPALAPGRYEIYAEAKAGSKVLGGYTEILIERNMTDFALPMNEVRESHFVIEGAGAAISASGLLRRKDLAGVGPAEPLIIMNGVGRAQISPGRWEFLATPPDGYYVSRFSGSRNNTARPDGWNDIAAGGGVPGTSGRFTITLSNSPGGIHGIVRSSGAPAASAPVFLEAWDPVTRARVVDLRETRADMRGNYRFESLAPGDYRIMSTYDYIAPDSGAFDAARAQQVRIDSSTRLQMDLELDGIP
jgi:hypothetical protein